MTYEHYITLIGEFINTGRSEERLLAEIGFPPDAPSEQDYITSISIIAAAADGDFKRLVKLSQLNLITFARKFMLPYRSVQNWCADIRKPPDYISILIGYAMISERWQSNGDI